MTIVQALLGLYQATIDIPPLDTGAKAEETPTRDARIASFIFIQSIVE